MRAIILQYAIIMTKGNKAVLSMMHGQGVYCGLSTASEVFLIFTTQLYPISSLPMGSKYSET